MIRLLVDEHGVDAQRVFITGLSAGGAMANAMLATYPEVFAGGAVIAGLPYGVASTVPEAFDRMRGHGLPDPQILRETLLAATSHAGDWPRLSVWQGTADNTVVEANAHAIVEQWRGVHGARATPDVTDRVDGQRHQVWNDASGRSAIELFLVDGMAHGTPLDVAAGYGRAAPFLLDVGISSTLHIAHSWGLAPLLRKQASTTAVPPAPPPSGHASGHPASGIQDVIEGALRKAGLMK
jgi:poly(3-hydroxybutyrate) depolymerase